LSLCSHTKDPRPLHAGYRTMQSPRLLPSFLPPSHTVCREGTQAYLVVPFLGAAGHLCKRHRRPARPIPVRHRGAGSDPITSDKARRRQTVTQQPPTSAQLTSQASSVSERPQLTKTGINAKHPRLSSPARMSRIHASGYSYITTTAVLIRAGERKHKREMKRGPRSRMGRGAGGGGGQQRGTP